MRYATRRIAPLSGLDGVILADYGKGMLTESFTRPLLGGFVDAGVPVAVDPKGNFSRYRGASLLKPNGTETRESVESRTPEVPTAESLSRQISSSAGGHPDRRDRGSPGHGRPRSGPAGNPRANACARGL